MLENKNTLSIILGIGIGITVSALFFLFVPTKTISDEQIIIKAQELGMIHAQQVPRESESNNVAEKEVVEIIIPSGVKSSEIIQILLENQIIKEEEEMTELINLLQISRHFKAGTYLLEKNGDMGKVLLILTGMKK